MPHNYTGTIATTSAGYDCQTWSQNDSDILNIVPIEDDHNYCRSLCDKSLGAWCYTTDPEIKWQYCSCPVQTSGKLFLVEIASTDMITFKLPYSALRQIGLTLLGTRVKIIQTKNTAISKDCMVAVGLRIMGPLIIGKAMDIQLGTASIVAVFMV